MEKTFNALFLSQRNAARSRLAAALLNNMGKGRFRAFSAGVRPAASIDPIAAEVLVHAGIAPGDPRARRCEEFVGEKAPPLDFVFTLSDESAGEAAPAWPGTEVTGHWRCEDPARFASDDPEHRLSLIRTRSQLERRLRAFINLPLDSLDRISLRQLPVHPVGSGAPSVSQVDRFAHERRNEQREVGDEEHPIAEHPAVEGEADRSH
jgi:protein-tyrosine-phosphatase